MGGLARGDSQPRRFGSVRNPALISAANFNGGKDGAATTESAFAADAEPSSGMLGSAALIARMRARQGTAGHPRNGTSSSLAAAGGSDRPKRLGEPEIGNSPSVLARLESGVYHGAEALMERIVSFLVASGGQTASNLLVEKFKDEVRLRQTDMAFKKSPHLLKISPYCYLIQVPEAVMPLFRQALKQVAELRRAPSGGIWVLREAFSCSGTPPSPLREASDPPLPLA